MALTVLIPWDFRVLATWRSGSALSSESSKKARQWHFIRAEGSSNGGVVAHSTPPSGVVAHSSPPAGVLAISIVVSSFRVALPYLVGWPRSAHFCRFQTNCCLVNGLTEPPFMSFHPFQSVSQASSNTRSTFSGVFKIVMHLCFRSQAMGLGQT